MPRTFETTVFQYGELSDDAKKKAVEWGQEFAHRTFEPSMLSEWMKDRLDEVGLPADDLEWSLSYSQGDGVAFYGLVEDLDKLVRHLRKRTATRCLRYTDADDSNYMVSVSLSRNSFGWHYSHWNTMSVDVEWSECGTDPTPAQAAAMDALYEAVKTFVQDTSRQLERDGYADIEYQSSEEQVIEMIEANEYEFDEEGNAA